VTIPASVRSTLGVSVGDRIDFVMNDDTGHYEVIPATCSVRSLKGILKRPAKPVSIEDMNAAIAESGASAR
jgi:AbrB family looped-hinge helix DNA binding protein